MGLYHATWSNRNWLIGIHLLFLVGYPLALATGIFIWKSFHFSPHEIAGVLDHYWYIFFLPPMVLFVLAWMMARGGSYELTRSTMACEMGRMDLQKRLEALCIAAGLPEVNLFIIDHKAFNALYWQQDEDRRLYVTQGACDGLSREELDCVMAQQLGRAAREDYNIYPLMSYFVAYGTLLSSAGFLMSGYMGIRALPLVFADYAFGLALYAVIISFGLIWLAFRYYGQYFGQCREFAADLYCVKLTKNAAALASAVNKSKTHYYMPIIPDELRAMLFINPDPGVTLPWYKDPDERIGQLRDALGAGVFTAS